MPDTMCEKELAKNLVTFFGIVRSTRKFVNLFVNDFAGCIDVVSEVCEQSRLN